MHTIVVLIIALSPLACTAGSNSDATDAGSDARAETDSDCTLAGFECVEGSFTCPGALNRQHEYCSTGSTLFDGLCCGEPPTPVLNTDVEDRVTITQGVYGQFLIGCDTSDCWTWYGDGDVAIFAVSPAPGLVGQPLSQSSVTAFGLFEIEQVEGGPYFLCAGEIQPSGFQVNQNCTEVQVGAGLQRHDFVAGPGGGNWN